MRYITLILMAAFLLSCGKKDSGSNRDSSENPFQVIPLKLQVDEISQLNPKQMNLYISLNEKGGVNYNHLSEAFEELHTANFRQQYAAEAGQKLLVYKALKEDIRSNIPGDISNAELKLKYETMIEKINGEEITYNSGFSNPLELSSYGAVQDFSGTDFYYLALRTIKTPSAYFLGNYVVVYQNGSLRPGFMVQESGQWNLYSIETTAKGEGLRHHGAAKKLKNMKVIDGNLYLLSKVFRNVMTNPTDVHNQALVFTAKKYGISLNSLQMVSSRPLLMNGRQQATQDLFSFGAIRSGESRREFDGRYHAQGNSVAAPSDAVIDDDSTGEYIDLMRELDEEEQESQGSQLTADRGYIFQDEDLLNDAVIYKLQLPDKNLRIFFKYRDGELYSRLSWENYYKKVLFDEDSNELTISRQGEYSVRIFADGDRFYYARGVELLIELKKLF